MLDLHNHLLPRVDDGSRSLGETLRHLEIFRREEVAEIVFTPHLLVPELPDERHLTNALAAHRGAYQAVLAAVARAAGAPRLALGQEVHAPCAEDAERVADRPEVGLAGTPCVLVEFGFDPAYEPLAVIDVFRAIGRTVILAHPERSWFPRQQDPLFCISRWREAGAWLQVDGGSLLGAYGERTEKLAWRLIEEGLAEVVATDHHGDARAHRPQRIRERLLEVVGSDTTARLTGETPLRLLETWHQPVDPSHRERRLAPAV